MNHVIVTGGTGVTGNALVRSLLSHNIIVTALVRPKSFRRKYLPEGHAMLEVVECGMEQYSSIHEQLKPGEYDAFFHLSWDGSTGTAKLSNRNNCGLQTKNIPFALEAVELCRRLNCPTFVMTGSQAEYGPKTHPIAEDEERKPVNAYGVAKQCAEDMTRILCREYGIRHIWPILFSVYGPNDATESLIDKSVRALLRGDSIPYTAGLQEWDYLYSYDAARALILLAEKGQDGEVYHVGNGVQRPLYKYIREIYEVLAPDLEPRLGEIPYSENTMMFLGADTTKLFETTGFVPSYSFKDGIREIAESIRRESKDKECSS